MAIYVGQSSPGYQAQTHTVNNVQKSFSFKPSWGKAFDDGGAGNTILGVVVDLYFRKGELNTQHNLNSTNQLYCQESMYNGIISFDNDYLAILQEALSRGERQ